MLSLICKIIHFMNTLGFIPQVSHGRWVSLGALGLHRRRAGSRLVWQNRICPHEHDLLCGSQDWHGFRTGARMQMQW